MRARRTRGVWAGVWTVLLGGVLSGMPHRAWGQDLIMRPRASTVEADAGEIDGNCFGGAKSACFKSLRYISDPAGTPTELPLVTNPVNVADNALEPFPWLQEQTSAATIDVDASINAGPRLDPSGVALPSTNESTPCNITATWGGFEAVLGNGVFDITGFDDVRVVVYITQDDSNETLLTDCSSDAPSTPTLVGQDEWVIEVLLNQNPADDDVITDQDVTSGAICAPLAPGAACVIMNAITMGVAPLQVTSGNLSTEIAALEPEFDPAKDLWVRVRSLSSDPNGELPTPDKLYITDIQFEVTYLLEVNAGVLDITGGTGGTAEIVPPSYKDEPILWNDTSTDNSGCLANGSTCSQQYVDATNGTIPYVWNIVEPPPPNLSLEQATCNCTDRLQLIGTPTVDAVGPNTMSVLVTDAVLATDGPQTLTHYVDGMRLLPRQLPSLRAGTPATITFTVVSSYRAGDTAASAPTPGACPNWVWAQTGTLPPGMTWLPDPVSNCFATLSGTPTALTGVFTVTVSHNPAPGGHTNAYTDSLTYVVNPMRIVEPDIRDVYQGMTYYGHSEVTATGVPVVATIPLVAGDAAIIAPGMTLVDAQDPEVMRVLSVNVPGNTVTMTLPITGTHNANARYEVRRSGLATTVLTNLATDTSITMTAGHEANFYRGAKIRPAGFTETMIVANIAGSVLTVIRDADNTGLEAPGLVYYDVVETPVAELEVTGVDSGAGAFVWSKDAAAPVDPAPPPTLLALPPDSVIDPGESYLYVAPLPVEVLSTLVVDARGPLVTTAGNHIPLDDAIAGDYAPTVTITDTRANPAEVAIFDVAELPYRILPRETVLLGRYPNVTTDRVLTFTVFGRGGAPTSNNFNATDPLPPTLESRNLTGEERYSNFTLQVDTWDDDGNLVIPAWFGPAPFAFAAQPYATTPLPVTVDMTNAGGISINGGPVILPNDADLVVYMPGAGGVFGRRYRFTFQVLDAASRQVDGLPAPANPPAPAIVDILIDEEVAEGGIQSRQKVYGR